MITVSQVPADVIISLISQDLKSKLQMPEWAKFVKTGPSRQRPPVDAEWWWIRAASIIRRISLDGPVGTNRLRTYYGSRKDRGVRTEKTYRAGGKIIRVILQELEKQELIKSTPRGKVLAPKGQSFMAKMSKKASEAGDGANASESKSTKK